MLLKEAKQILKKNGYRLVEDTDDYEDADLGINSTRKRYWSKTLDREYGVHALGDDESIEDKILNTKYHEIKVALKKLGYDQDDLEYSFRKFHFKIAQMIEKGYSSEQIAKWIDNH